MDDKIAIARKKISEFRETDFNLNDDDQVVGTLTPDRKKLQAAVKKLSEDIYSKETHFIFELIQNAEDNSYSKGQEPELVFQLQEVDPTNTPGSDGCLCVFNNEDGFSEENIKAICNVGDSTKKNEDG